VVFKRRDRRGWLRVTAEFLWPRGGWRRAAGYVMHRLRRLPDSPHRICLGIACGAFVSFLPIFGLHFLAAALLAWLLRANVLASLLGTFWGNPFTFPFMAVAAMELGNWLLGNPGSMGFSEVMGAIGRATSELTHNFFAMFTEANAHWGRLQVFWWRVFLPYTLGGVILGIPGGIAVYYVHLPMVRAYQRRRLARLKDRFEAARRRDRENTENDEP